MEVKEIKDKEIWENFLLDCKEKTFLDSWKWGTFQVKMKNKIFRFGVFDDNRLIAIALVAKIISRRGTFLLIQHGPVIKSLNPQTPNLSIEPSFRAIGKSQILKLLLEKLKKIAQNEKANFIRVAPLWERSEENIKIFKDLGFKEAPMHASAYESTWKLDITVTEETLLKKMRKTTRYLIRKALKNKDIQILKSENIDDIKIYQELNKKVSKRQNFIPFSSNFIKNEFETFLKEKQSLLIFGKYKNEIVAGALIIFWSKIGFYHQAASIKKYSKFSIPYLIQWEAIKEAKKRGCVLYDFWGYIDPFKYPKHPWAGPTLFKMGFSGYEEEYIKTKDFPLTLFYWLTFLFEKIRKIKRNL